MTFSSQWFVSPETKLLILSINYTRNLEADEKLLSMII